MTEPKRTSNGFYEVYDPKEDVYHLYGSKQAARNKLAELSAA